MPQVPYKVNLLPPNLQREGVIDISRLIKLIAITLLIALVVGSYGAFLISFWGAKSELAAARQELKAISPVVSRVTAIRKERAAAEATYKEYSSLLDSQLAWSNILTGMFCDFNNIIPVDLWLVDLEVAPGTKAEEKSQQTEKKEKTEENSAPEQFARANTVKIKGSSRTVSSVGVFMKNLNELPYLKDIALNKVKAGDNDYVFEITAVLKGVE